MSQPRDAHGRFASPSDVDDFIRRAAGRGVPTALPPESAEAVDGLEGGVRPRHEMREFGEVMDDVIRTRGHGPVSLGRAPNGIEIFLIR